MCAKVKTKRGKVDFKTGIQKILEAHSLYLEPEQLDPLLDSLLIYFNEKFKPDDSVPFFAELVSQYMAIFEEITEGEKASFNDIMGINLKRLSKILKYRYLTKNPNGIWDLNTCLTQHEIYYRMVITIPFMKQNFTPTMMYSKHNENVATLAARRISQEQIDKKILGG